MIDAVPVRFFPSPAGAHDQSFSSSSAIMIAATVVGSRSLIGLLSSVSIANCTTQNQPARGLCDCQLAGNRLALTSKPPRSPCGA